MNNMIGQTVGNYRILEKRGEGGMGMFFKAVDLHLDRVVGLKTLRPELLADPDLRQRLQTEAKSLARLVHPNIANVLHYLIADDMDFIVMEFVEGFDLAEIVRHDGLFDLSALGSIVAQVCAAVGYAHGRNVIHRDLKPSNIMMTADGTCKVTDFGIAKIIGASAQTRTGMAAGSLHYMAPEQIRAAGVDARTDIYQLGATFFELATGRRPFVSDSEYDLMTMHLQEEPPAASAVNSRVPAALDAVLLKALAKSPDDRYPSTEEFDRAFRAALDAGRDDGKTVFAMPAVVTSESRGDSAASKTSYTPPRTKPATPSPAGEMAQGPTPVDGAITGSSKQPLIWGGAAIVAVLAVVVGYFVLRPTPPDETGQDDQSTAQTVNIVAPCTLVVHSNIPEGIKPGDVAKTYFSLSHPDSGASRTEVAWTGGRLEHQVVVGPTSLVQIGIEGLDAKGAQILAGEATSGAPEGGHIVVGVPLRSLVTASTSPDRPDTPPDTPPDKPATTVALNLAINVTPFAERGRIDKLWIDDREVEPASEFEYRVQPGRRKVRVQVGDDRLTDTVTVPPSGKATLNLFIGAGRGRISVAALFGSEGGYADIVLDGVATGFGTPYEIRDVLEGPHEISVTQEGYRARGGSQFITVRGGDRVRAEFSMTPR